MSTQKPVFAIYDFRTKQQYIFRTNSVKECMGASRLIAGMYHYFIQELKEKKGWAIEENYEYSSKDCKYINDVSKPFDPWDQDQWGQYSGRVIYVGGGSLYMLWRDTDTAHKANRTLCYLLREKTYSLSAVCGMAECIPGGSYMDDFKAAYADYKKIKALAPAFLPSAALPFTKFDRKTSLPIAGSASDNGEVKELSKESLLKRAEFDNYIVEIQRNGWKNNTETFDFDKMVTKKGDESLLAVIHIDGNNMGYHVQKTMDRDFESYSEAVRTIREFSNRVQEIFIDKPIDAVEKMLETKDAAVRNKRNIITGGDDVTLVCNARVALEVVKTFFESIRDSNENHSENDKHSVCAGICIFHSHFPFARAYDIAEECCDAAKKKNRECSQEIEFRIGDRNEKRRLGNNMLVDFQHCFSGTAGGLDALRNNDVNAQKSLRPYSLEAGQWQLPTISDYIGAAIMFKNLGRSNIKHLSEINLNDKKSVTMEIKRLQAQSGKLSDTDVKEMERKEYLKYLHDVAQMYDIWFADHAEENQEVQLNG